MSRLDAVLMHWPQLQFTPCEALPSVWICFAWPYSQACGHPCCLCTFSYPISSFQSTLHLICFDTALLEQPPLSVMTLCDLPSLWRVSIIIFWIISMSAVFPIIVVSNNKRYPEFILYGWSCIEIFSFSPYFLRCTCIWRALFQNAINAKKKKISLSCHFAVYWTYSLLHQCFMPNRYISLFKMYCKMQFLSKPL